MKYRVELSPPAKFLLSYVAILALLCWALTACSGMSLASKADAAYGSFVIAEKAGAELILSPEVSDSTKAQIKSADAAAKPVADALLSAILSYRTSPEKADSLQRALDIALPAIRTLAVETSK